MRSETPDEKRINQLLTQLTHNSRVLDAGVYDEQGDLVARSAKASRFATAGAGRQKSRRLLQPADCRTGSGKMARWAICVTLDTHTLATERQVDNTTNILRLMLLLSLAIGVVLTRTLLQGKHPLAAIALPAHRQQAG
jgi:membrane protein